MHRPLVIALLVVVAFSSVAAAAPAVNIARGDLTASLVLRDMDIQMESGFDLGNTDVTEISVAAGLTDRQSLVIGNMHTSQTVAGIQLKGDVTDYNLQHRLNDYWAVFAGMKQIDTKATAYGVTLAKETEDKLQAGVVFNKAFTDKITGYATVAVADDTTDYQAGVTYHVTRQAALELGYRSFQSGDLEFSGLGYGLNVTF